MTPLSFKSVATWFNISKDKGPVLKLVGFTGDGSNQNRWSDVDAVVEGFAVSIWSCGTIIGGRISSSGGVCDRWGTATDVRTSFLFCEDVSSDNMGSKEFSVGIFSFKEGTNFIKFSTVEVVRSFSVIPYENNSYGYNTYASKY